MSYNYKEYRQAWRKFAQELTPGAEIRRKVKESLDDESQEKITKYLDWLYGNISNSIQAIRKGVTLVLALMLAFELIAGSSATASVTIFSVNIPKHSIIFQFIPAVTAFIYLQIIQDSIDIDRARVAFSRAFELWSKESGVNRLDEYIWPPSRLYWNPFDPDEPAALARFDKITNRVRGSFEAMFSVLVLAYFAQAYYVLFVPHLNENLILWIVSLCFTLFCIGAGTILLLNNYGIFELRRATREIEHGLKEAASIPKPSNE